jgi:ABC-2 type transport system permease protein
MSDGSVIHDIGYQRYRGQRLGSASNFMALFLHGLRAAFGLGRSAKAKIFPWIAVGLIGSIALIIAAAQSQGNDDFTYLELPSIASVVVLVFLAVIAPELVSRDLRNNLLPLYFSRPLSRARYAGAKLLSVVTAIWLMLAGPQTLIFAASAIGGRNDLFTEIKAFLAGWVVSAAYAIVYGTVGVLVASVASRRAFAAGAIAAVFLVTLPVVGVLVELGGSSVQALAPLASPTMLPEGISEALFSRGNMPILGYGPLYLTVGILLPVLSMLLLALRYRRVSL